MQVRTDTRHRRILITHASYALCVCSLPLSLYAATRLVDRLALDIVRKYDTVRTSDDRVDADDPEHKVLGTVLVALNAELRILLSPHMSDKNLDALSEVVRYFTTSMGHLAEEPACFMEFGRMADALRRMYGLPDAA